MIELAETISFWIMFVIGVCVAIVGLFTALDWALTYTFRSLQLYNDIVEFLRKKYKDKRVYTPKYFERDGRNDQ